MRTLRPWLIAATCATGLVLAVPQATGAPPRTDGGLTARARSQIEALARDKAGRTPDENKLDSALLTASRLASGRPPAALSRVRSGVRLDASGRTVVDLHGTVTSSLLARIRAVGGVVRRSDPASGVLRAEVPVSGVLRLAALPEVRHIVSLASTPLLAGGHRPAPTPPESRLTRQVADALRSAGTQPTRRPTADAAGPSGSVVSEGDKAHGVDQARDRLHVSGIGVTVGVLSDGVDSLATTVAAGELPPDVQVLPDPTTSGDEGTAMLEIVHDLAPKARLAFATANGGPAGFADNIRALRAAGADVLVDDVVYADEPAFQDGPVARAVLDVTRDGAVYLSSAQNFGNLDDGTSGTYEDTFRPSPAVIGKFVGMAHDFDPGPGVQVLDPLSGFSDGTLLGLQWANPAGAASDDYDLYLLDPSGNVVAFSNAVQDGNDDPLELLQVPDFGGPFRVAVTRFKGADRYLQVTSFGGRFRADGDLPSYATAGSTRGHADVPAALAVAAVPAAAAFPADLEPGDPPNPAGPFPGVYQATQRPERFTSDGPRRVFFSPTGAPLTPGDLTSTGGVQRRKPDVAAADGVSTSVSTLPFFGTSASAAHAAAIAALLRSGAPGASPAQVRRALTRTALDLAPHGPDRDTGSGVLLAGPALDAVRARAQAYAVPGSPTVSTSTDHDRFLEPGETALVRVPVTNVGDATATGVSVTVTSPTPGVVVRPAIKPYGPVPVGRTRFHSYRVSVPRSAPLGSVVQLSMRVRFAGGFSPQGDQRSVDVGQPSTKVVTSAYTGPDVAIPDNTEAGVSVPLPVSGVGELSRVTFSVDGHDCSAAEDNTTVGLQHTWVSDLVGRLTGPDGTSVTLFDRPGGLLNNGNNFCQTVFTDAATSPIQDAQREGAPFTGDWRPAEPLKAFVGRSGDGDWRFTVADVAVNDTGVLHSVSLHVSGFEPPPD